MKHLTDFHTSKFVGTMSFYRHHISLAQNTYQVTIPINYPARTMQDDKRTFCCVPWVGVINRSRAELVLQTMEVSHANV